MHPSKARQNSRAYNAVLPSVDPGALPVPVMNPAVAGSPYPPGAGMADPATTPPMADPAQMGAAMPPSVTPSDPSQPPPIDPATALVNMHDQLAALPNMKPADMASTVASLQAQVKSLLVTAVQTQAAMGAGVAGAGGAVDPQAQFMANTVRGG